MLPAVAAVGAFDDRDRLGRRRLHHVPDEVHGLSPGRCRWSASGTVVGGGYLSVSLACLPAGAARAPTRSLSRTSPRPVDIGAMVDLQDVHRLGGVVETEQNPIRSAPRAEGASQITPQRLADSTRLGGEVPIEELDDSRNDSWRRLGKIPPGSRSDDDLMTQ